MVNKYPQVQNLTKTLEFRHWVKTTVVSEQTGTHHETTVGSEQVGTQHETTSVSEQAGIQHETTVGSEQAGTQHETTSVSEQAGTQHETTVGSEQAGTQHETPPAVNEQARIKDEPITVTPGNIYVEPGLVINEYIVNNNSNVDIISEAMPGGVEDVDEGIERLADMNAIISNIVRDLEAVEPAIFQDLNDEGIGLNTEDEVGIMLDEYDIDNLW